MNNIRFDWDKSKAALNKKKHGVSFEEAVTVFYDDYALEFFDPDHSEDEDRLIMLGMSFKARILVVCHCVREASLLIRIISARKAGKHEAQGYREERI
ncbi:MAG: BrnT family toxin [Candidatus Omnitrophica bacterium]|nr:BrnT family toxin [Candidatus Omnitrophota bacterium]